ncbi:hypothetical protein OHC33_004200 [Knufia fluminis]|uniref:SUN domain-containing protein n=1 Tax=Knufia fluminis TaxID=191047 RepID=A0AAN8F0D0_9EURO|nr:hypothetical protein OHC33_004200 [Knufia fluminis]
MQAAILTLPQLLLLLSSTSVALNTSSPLSSSSSASICPARTINYITHSLPQQCLATDRVVNTTLAQAPQSDTASVNGPTPEYAAPLASPSNAPPSATDITAVTLEPTTVSTTGSESITPRTVASPTNEVPNELAQIAEPIEEDSALESGNFLSFEEWKKQNLKKAGQSEHIGRRSQVDAQEPRNRPDRIHNSLESLGDDGEIDLDFSGFVPGGPEKPAHEVSIPLAETTSADEVPSPPAVLARSKDAGTTCKERFNYASFDCAANVLKTNKEAKSPNTVLVENKDSYMLNQCSAQNKFIILELCNDILIDTVVLANFEFFSSTFRTFRVSVSDRYPVKVEKWKTIGTYEARNTREVQAFLVEDPVIWARYLRIEFLSHYGNEFYCPVSLVRIHGTTMMEDYKHGLERALDEDSDDSEQQLQDEEAAVDGLTPEAVAEPLTSSTHADGTPTIEAFVTAESSLQHSPEIELQQDKARKVEDAETAFPASLAAVEAIMSVIESSDTCLPAESPTGAWPSQATTDQHGSLHVGEPAPAVSTPIGNSAAISNGSQSVSSVVDTTTTKPPGPELGKNLTDYKSSMSTTNVRSETTSSPVSNQAGESMNAAVTSSYNSTKVKSPSSTAERSKSSTPTQAQPSAPTTQDSFFKSVQKRLQLLETNSSMSLQYIEDQSRALRDAFKKVEQRQLSRTNTFLDQLNHTVLYELREFRQQYDQLWQSTVLELDIQRERYERDNEAINARIGILADEVIFQRRMAILQMILILVCLILVLFSRGAINNYLELPIVQNVLAKSPSSKWLNLSTGSPNRPTQPVRTRSAHQLRSERSGILKGHRRMQSDDSTTDTPSGTEVYAPATPVSEYGQSEVELIEDVNKTPTFESDRDDSKLDDPEFDPSLIERPATSPPTLRLNGGSPIIDLGKGFEEDLIDARIAAKSDNLPSGHDSPKLANGNEPHPVKHLSWNLPEG